MSRLSAMFIFAGFLLVMGAVGGMDNPDQAEYFFEQLVAAGMGVFFALLGVLTLPEEFRDE